MARFRPRSNTLMKKTHLHVEGDNGLPGARGSSLGEGPDNGAWHASVLLGLVLVPQVDGRRPLLHEKAEVENVLHRLGEGLGIKEVLNGVNERSLLLDMPPLPPHLVLIQVGGLSIGLERLEAPLARLVRLLVQNCVDDCDVSLNGRQLVGVRLGLFLVDLLNLLFLPPIVLMATPLALLPLLGHVHYVDGPVEEGDARRDRVKAGPCFPAQEAPIKVGPQSSL